MTTPLLLLHGGTTFSVADLLPTPEPVDGDGAEQQPCCVLLSCSAPDSLLGIMLPLAAENGLTFEVPPLCPFSEPFSTLSVFKQDRDNGSLHALVQKAIQFLPVSGTDQATSETLPGSLDPVSGHGEASVEDLLVEITRKQQQQQQSPSPPAVAVVAPALKQKMRKLLELDLSRS
jgi:hypothetical protein